MSRYFSEMRTALERHGASVEKFIGEPVEVRARVGSALTAIGDGVFDPIPGAWCSHRDFRRFCEAGKAWLAANI